MNEHEELKKLSLEVAQLQESLIELGDAVQEETCSFSSWLKSTFLFVNLPFDVMAKRAERLVAEFVVVNQHFLAFETNFLKHLPQARQDVYVLLKQYHQQLFKAASILLRNQRGCLEASRGKSKISFDEGRRNSNEYNEATLEYAATGARLQPYIEDLFST
ncbi:hypothetical protein [Geomonas propionica]|uniref:Uncharacterized protein n=1 Tax=Geomonas propionica TaxID=2798582 RepID=A0ABS0YZ66_9BACT|nr:hypothetical protein [Geomonas propionica]MBJ6802805.1 hypothetical protein [Geomonas propionica]